MRLYTLLRDVEIIKTNVADLSCEAGRICEHSEDVCPGCIFICISGITHDGHDYIDSACRRGASLIVAERMTEELSSSGVAYVLTPDTRVACSAMWRAYYGEPQRTLRLFAITGTNGKSSTAYVLRSILYSAGRRVGMIGSVKNEYADLVLPESPMTTPDPRDLYEMLSKMKASGAEDVVIEASSHALALGKLHGLTFEGGIFTNLSAEHLDFHPSMGDYAAAKARLFERCRVALANADDPWVHTVTDGACCPVRTYSVKGKADYGAKGVEYPSLGGVTYFFTSRKEMFSVASPLSGLFSVYNTLAAASLAYEIGIPPTHIAEGIRTLASIPGRMERVENTGGLHIYIDYAHTPAALEAAIKEVRRYARGRVITLMGCGGMRDKAKRPFMGRVATELSDLTVVTTDNPRGEDPAGIITEILSGVDDGGKVAVVRDREEAIAYAISEAKEGDTLLLAGKGHEEYQILADGMHPFSEKEIIKKYLK